MCSECGFMSEHMYVIRRHMQRHSVAGCECHVCGRRYKVSAILITVSMCCLLTATATADVFYGHIPGSWFILHERRIGRHDSTISSCPLVPHPIRSLFSWGPCRWLPSSFDAGVQAFSWNHRAPNVEFVAGSCDISCMKVVQKSHLSRLHLITSSNLGSAVASLTFSFDGRIIPGQRVSY